MTQPFVVPRTFEDWEVFRDDFKGSPAEERALDESLERTRNQIESRVHQQLCERSWSEHARGEALWDEGQQVVDGFEALHARGVEGTISADDYAKEHLKLVRRQATLERQADELERAAQRTAELLADPIAYHSALLRKYPSLQGVRLVY
jgi:hypothetical protein